MKAATIAVLLAGWSAEPPAHVPRGPHGFDHGFLELYNIGGIAKLWRAHAAWLREQARLWIWSPTFTLGDRVLFYGEYVAAGGAER